MPFWKRSEDPWDMDPARERAKTERKPVENPLDTLRDWNQERKARAAAKQAALEAQPKEVCPWCGKEMEQGVLSGGKGIYWYPGRASGTAFWLGGGAIEGSFRVDDEGVFNTCKTAWYCRDCRRMVLSQEEPENRQSPYEKELNRYFQDAWEDGGEETV